MGEVRTLATDHKSRRRHSIETAVMIDATAPLRMAVNSTYLSIGIGMHVSKC